MQFLKKYEEFDYGIIGHFWPLLIPITISLFGKYLNNKREKRWVKDFFTDTMYSGYKIERDGYDINISINSQFSNGREFSINTKTRKVTYQFSTRLIEITISQEDMNKFLKEIEKYEQSEEILTDILQDVKDNFGFNFTIRHSNLQMNSFVVELLRQDLLSRIHAEVEDIMEEDNIEEEESGAPINTREEIDEFADIMYEVIDRIEDEFNTKLSSSAKGLGITGDKSYLITKEQGTSGDHLHLKKIEVQSVRSEEKLIFNKSFNLVDRIPGLMSLNFKGK